MSQEELLKQILDKLEEIRHQENMNDSSSDISSIQMDIDSIRSDLGDIKDLLKERG